MEWIAVAIAGMALVVSAVTAYLTLFQAGQLRMTQPTVLFFGPDGGPVKGERNHFKVFLRTLLYSTSRRGQMVESMHVSLQRANSKQNFPIWVYRTNELVRGSGLHAGHEGVTCDHHFLLPWDGTEFRWMAGQYHVRVYAKRVTDRKPQELAHIVVSISESQAQQLTHPNAGIYFDWGPDEQGYQSHVQIKKPTPLPPWLREAMEVS